jgi:LPS sulfotransferase NodH
MQLYCSYLICSTPQSGSKLLSEILKKTGIAGRPEEYFEMSRIIKSITQSGSDAKQSGRSEWSKLWDVGNYAHYLAEVIEEGTSRNGIFGAHLMWDYFDDFVLSLRLIPAYKELPVSDLLSTLFSNVHYIWVTRRNKLQHAIALWQAIQREIWMLDDSPASNREPAFNFEAIDSLLQQIVTKEEDWWRFFDACHLEPFTVVYEDLVNGTEATIREVLRYLEISPTNDPICVDWSDHMQADALSEEWVKRYHVLKQAQQSRLLA